MADNYAAEVVRVDTVNELAGCDNVVGISVFGYQAIVGKDTVPGTYFVVFPAESQLSDTVASKLNLYRDPTLNSDTSAKGYLEKNRRVKAMRFRGHTSNMLAVPLADFVLAMGLTPPQGPFNEIDGVEISRKYVVPVKQSTPRNPDKKRRRVETKFFPAHYDTAQFLRNRDLFSSQDYVVVTQKLHGTSARLGRTYVDRKLTWLERLAQRFGVRVQEKELTYVAGSRNAIKDLEDGDQKHFYGFDLWNDALNKYKSTIPDNTIIYGELVGFLPDGKPIQNGYTYGQPVDTYALYVYRVAVVTEDGQTYDLPWNGVETFARERGLKTVPVIWRGLVQDLPVEVFLDPSPWYGRVPDAVKLSNPKSPEEGVVIRRDGVVPLAQKLKNPEFLEWETKVLDKGEEVLS